MAVSSGSRWDVDALKAGASVSLVFAVPFSIAARWAADSRDDSTLALWLSVGALVGFVIGAGCGVVVGCFAWWLTRLLKDGPSDGTVSIRDSVGLVAKVVTDIPGDGYGVVRVVVGGHPMRLNASAHRAIEAGAEVTVTGVLSPTAVNVTEVWPS